MIRLDYRDARPFYEQVKDGLRRLMVTGVLAPGEKLPSVRALSIQLSVNPNTIQKAYSELDLRGLLCAVPGKGCFVASGAQEVLARSGRERLGSLRTLTEELALAGVPLDELLQTVRQAYEEAKK